MLIVFSEFECYQVVQCLVWLQWCNYKTVVLLLFMWVCGGYVQAVRKLTDAKKLESSAHYSTDFGKE